MKNSNYFKNILPFSAVALIAFCSSAGMASAAPAASSITITGTIDSNTPLADDVGTYSGETANDYGWCNAYDRTDVRPFTVGQTGTYGFTDLQVNPSANLFVQINTTPGPNYNPTINADTYGVSPVAAAPEGILTAGTNYNFVAVSACSSGSFPFDFSVVLYGDGELSFGSSGPVAKTLRPVRYTTAPDLIPSNVPTCNGSKFVSGVQVLGGGKVTWYVEHSKKDECFSVDVNVLPEGVSAKDMDEVLAVLGTGFDVYSMR